MPMVKRIRGKASLQIHMMICQVEIFCRSLGCMSAVDSIAVVETVDFAEGDNGSTIGCGCSSV